METKVTKQFEKKKDRKESKFFRNYTLEYKLSLVEEMEKSEFRGDITRIAQREGINRGLLYHWLHQKKSGQLNPTVCKVNDERELELEQLRKENEQLKMKLNNAEAIIEIQKKNFKLVYPDKIDPEKRAELMNSIRNMSNHTTIKRSCDLLGIARSSYYHYFKDDSNSDAESSKHYSGYRMPESQKLKVLDIMNNAEFEFVSPYQIFYSLLDRQKYYCSIRSMYRILSDYESTKYVRIRNKKVQYRKPQLCATHPNQVWSWDITFLKGFRKGEYFYLYVMLDIYSRYVVGWTVERHDSAELASDFILNCVKSQSISTDQLTIHSDRGSSMRSDLVVSLIRKLGLEKSYSRPRVSNDNPYSESNFSTLKRHISFPIEFENLASVKAYCTSFFEWYNQEHYHSGLNYYKPYSVHYGKVDEIYRKRLNTINKYKKSSDNPNIHRLKVKRCPTEVWINKPLIENLED